MASAAPNNRVYLFRLQTLVIDGGLLVLRHILDHTLHVQNILFSVCLSQEKPTLTRLKSRNTITQCQYDLLFPVSGQSPSTSDLDITLIICLLRNLKTCGLNKKYNWSIPPLAGDKSLEADLYRLKQYRNEIAHIATTTGINLNDFISKWNEIEQILQRLDLSNPVPDLQKIIDDIKASPLDTEAEERIEKTIKEWKEMEKSLEVDLKLLKKNLQEHSKILTEMKKRMVYYESQQTKRGAVDAKLDYLKKRRNLKEDLITLYRHQYHTLPLSPLIKEHDTPLLDFYVMPNITVVEGQRIFGEGSEIKSQMTSLQDVFYKKTKLCRSIYVIADAGLGKTAFSKRLALTWCQAHKRKEEDTKCFKQDEINAMSEFEFVFLLLLRDCTEECDIDQMIRKQILPLLAHRSSIIESVLFEEKCLVILDGLDEWTHPKTSCADRQSGIPHRKARECTTILTTSRKWKFSVINLKSSQIDLKLELGGLSEVARGELKKSIIRLLSQNAENTIDDQIEVFNSTVAEKGVTDLESVPLLLMFLLCLWCDHIDLGQSKCVIYCQMLELLLKQTFERYPEMKNTCPRPIHEIPECFAKQVNCRENYTFLLRLGRLACEALFSKTRENTLVFESSLVDKHLNPDFQQSFLELGLRSGIITQDKVSKLTSEKHKTSFSHKTVQEFFAALYLSTCPNYEVRKTVLSFCNCLKNILEMSQLFIFISGIKPGRIAIISEILMKVINEDEITRTYRSETMPLFDSHEEKLKQIQDMYISCFKNIPENTNINISLQDFIFNKDCQQESYYKYLQGLALHNKNNIKTISIKIEGIRSLPEIIKDCDLKDRSLNCQKIYYRGECEEVDYIHLLSSSTKCITIISHKWQNNRFGLNVGSWGRGLSEKIVRIYGLQAIYIDDFNFRHVVLEWFLNFLVKRKSIKDIKLFRLFCECHGTSCSGFNFDLYQHYNLRHLGLNNIPLSQLNVNVSLLEECQIGEFSNPGIVTSYLNNISAASKLQTFKCGYLKSSDDIRKMLQTLSFLVAVKRVMLFKMNLGDKLLPHEIVNVEYVWLWNVTMSILSLRYLVSWIKNLPHQVIVNLVDCKITKQKEFESFKKDIQTSKLFCVVRDIKVTDDSYEFKFASIK